MKLPIAALFLLMSAAAVAAPYPSPVQMQNRRGQILHMGMDLERVRNELALKKKQLKGVTGRGYATSSWAKKLDHDIKNLQNQEAILNLNLEKIKTAAK